MATDPMRWGNLAAYLSPYGPGLSPSPYAGWQGVPRMDAQFHPAAAAQPETTVELQALTGFLQDASSNAIRKLFEYLSKNGERFPQLASGVGLLNQAVDTFKARDFARSFSQIYEIYRYIAAMRAASPEIPALT